MNRQAKNTKRESIQESSGFFKSLFRLLSNFFAKLDDAVDQYSEYRQSKKAIWELTALDDQMLKDIGITKADVARVQMTKTPACELKQLNQARTKNIRRNKGFVAPKSTATLSLCC